MQYVLGNMLNGGGGLNPDGLALDLQFAADKTFSKPSSLAASETAITSRKGPSAVFSRASGATFVDSDGLIKWGNENLFTRSEDFTQAIWVKTNVTVTGDNAISPDGTSNADSMFETTANGQHLVTFSPTAFAGPASLSVYAKSIGGRHITIEFNSTGGNGAYARINLANGTVVISGAYGTGYTFISASALSVGNGWYRCTLSATLPSSWTGWFRSDDGSTSSFVGDPTRGLQLWGAQLERHTSVRQYIPTTTSAVYAPRFDHTSAGVCRGLLIEESRTNSQRYSSELNLWGTLQAVTTISNSTTAPDGATVAELVAETSVSQQHFISDTFASIVSGTTYTLSVFAKKGSGATAPDLIQLTGAAAGFGTSQFATFNITTGVVNNSTGGTASIQNFGNGWYRLIWTVAATATVTAGMPIGFVGSSPTVRLPAYTGLTTSDVFLWGAQLEAGGFATSYIPTTTGSVVRSADVCSITGANFTSFWNTNEGAMFASGDPRGSASVATLVMANSGANANQISFDRSTTTIKFGVANSGTYTATIQQNSTNGSFVKISGAYATNNARSALNGVLGTPDTSVIVPTNLNRFNIGSASTANSEFANGCISEIKYFRKPLSNAKLQSLTA